MADEEQTRIGRFLSAIASPFRTRTTPEPQMPLYTTGIQEPVLAQGITIPALYAVSHENLILRTVISKLQQEIFRRGYYWEKKFQMKCVECDEEYNQEVQESANYAVAKSGSLMSTNCSTPRHYYPGRTPWSRTSCTFSVR